MAAPYRRPGPRPLRSFRGRSSGVDPRSIEALFLGSQTNRIDAKGRVAVPADFRRALETGPTRGIYCLKGLYLPRLECGGGDFIANYLAEIEDLKHFSDNRELLEEHILGSVRLLAFDSEGRVVIPEDFRQYANLKERALFQGRGKRFLILDSESAEKRIADTRDAAREALRARTSNGAGR
ncbi:MAG TPA: division/cell wall cluster transcriptional repressor MraZ [Parvularcula sp.]|nr:division/cell wall cluster transcriptional repressor MraZ [Parvularcula sp.]HBS30690.1 division/cell wall cluster transcriptional repressor MraZ [Parvularcula sp.]